MYNNKVTKVISKKDFIFGRIGSFGQIELVKDQEYDHFLIEDENVMNDNIPYKHKYVFLFKDYNGTVGRRFHLNKHDTDSIYPNFYDYFYDENEIRKLKLEKLNKQ